VKYAVQWLLLALILLSSIQVPAEDQEQPLKGAYIEFPPLSYTDESGQPSGSYIERVDQLAEKAGYDIQWQGLPIDRIYLYLKEGEIDVWLGSSEVPALSDWTREPDFTFPPIRLNAYHTDDTEAIDKLEDLEGESLILIRGYTYLNRLAPITEAPETRVGKAPDHEASLRMLKAGRGDYLLGFEAPVANALQNEPLPQLKQHLLTQWNTSLVFSLHASDLDRVIRDFESAWQATEGG
jgi:polar amino acid transport system substrate-binding protein